MSSDPIRQVCEGAAIAIILGVLVLVIGYLVSRLPRFRS